GRVNPKCGGRRGVPAWASPIVLSGVSLMQLAGCSRGLFEPDFAFAIPGKYEAAKSVAPPQVRRWRTRFRSSELDGLMEVANIENLDIAVAVAQLEQADAQAQITGAALWPTLTYSDNSSRSRSSGTNVPGVISPGTERNSFSKVINAS